jgi:hypothetical protein
MRRLEQVEALFCLLTASVVARLAPFRWLRAYLGHFDTREPVGLHPDQEVLALRVRGLIRGVCRALGWKPRCLARALAATVMLRRRGLQPTLYLGIPTGDPNLRAHAWVRCGGVTVVGGVSRWKYAALGGFSHRE